MQSNKEIRAFWKELEKSSGVVNLGNEKFPEIIGYQPNKAPLIEVKNLGMSYKNMFTKKIKEIFHDVSFNIYPNEITAIIGSNGAGKTTIVDIVSGIKKPIIGDIVFNYEHHLTDKLGVQFQDLSFPKGLTVKDMLEFELSLNEKIDAHELNEMLETFRLKQLLKTNISKLSGGQQQRLNVIISLMNKPRVVFLDEFTTGLDIAIKNQIKDFIILFAKRHEISIVLISHDIDVIEELVDHFIVLADKHIVVDCSRDMIIQSFGTVSNFLRCYIK